MPSDAVTVRTAQDVTTLYEQLWNLRPPHSTDDQSAAPEAARAFAAEPAGCHLWPGTTSTPTQSLNTTLGA